MTSAANLTINLNGSLIETRFLLLLMEPFLPPEILCAELTLADPQNLQELLLAPRILLNYSMTDNLTSCCYWTALNIDNILLDLFPGSCLDLIYSNMGRYE